MEEIKELLIKFVKMVIYCLIGFGGLYILCVFIGNLPTNIMEWSQIQKAGFVGIGIGDSFIIGLALEGAI